MLVAAQRLHRDVVFVFVDEGEALATVRDYLKAQSLAPGNLLLDGNQRLAQATNTRGFPSTFFFAADGRLVAQHLGMLSPATLARALEQLAAATRPAARPSTQSGGNLVRRPPASSASAFRAMHPRSARVAGARDRT